MNLTDLLSIGIAGAGLSFIVNALKTRFGTEGLKTKGLTILLAIVVGAAFYFFQGTSIWTSIIGVLMAASTVYAFFLK